MNKVIIVTYYWPPSGGGGVQRWLKFAKYLPQFGWEPIIVTPENPNFSLKDESLMHDVSPELRVIKLPIWEPHELFYKLKGVRSYEKVNQNDIIDKPDKKLSDKLGIWLRGNLFIPDPRVFWVKPTFQHLKKLMREEGIQTVITTGPPHSMHLIGKKLKQALGVTWLADFRDPWTGWFMYREFSISSLASRLHQQQEQKVLRAADRVTTVSDILANDLSNIAGREVETLTNGFDPDDFQDFTKHLSAQSEKFVIKHTGTIDLVRDPRPLLHAITSLCNEHKDFAESVEINFIGHLSGVISSEINRSPIAEKITLTPYLPHKQLKQEYASASVLLLLLSTAPETKCVLSGKTFEYLASSTPILAIGPTDGEVARVLKRTGAGVLVDPGNLEGIKKELLILFNRFKQHEMNREIQPDISSFSRVSLSEKLADMLNQTLK